MQSAYDEIISTYDTDTMAEIANHGCSSGVCFQHIYYGDTTRFYDKHEDEILDYINDSFGVESDPEFLVDMFRRSNADITCYKNTVVWCFIEMIAFTVYDDSLLQPA